MAERSSRYFARPEIEGRWPSFVFSLAITAAAFVAALVSMTTLSDWREPARPSVADAPVLVRLPAPTVPPIVKPVVPQRATPVVETPRAAPTPTQRAVPSPIAIPSAPSISPPVASPLPPGTGARDSTDVTTKPATGAAASSSRGMRGSGKGAPMAPAGINLADRAANTPAVRDSIITQKMLGIPELARTRAPTGRERMELEASQRQAALLRARTGTAGNGKDLVILQGRGRGGVGAVSAPGMISIDAPLLSSGPSPAQRKKNEEIDADYQRRLRRLDDRVLLKRDSIRADSLRADSLRRAALMRRP